MMTEIKKSYNSKSKYCGQRFMLTVHGQHKIDFEKLTAFFSTEEVKAAVIAREFGKNKIHPHWQVYFELFQERSCKQLIQTLLGHDNFHLEVAKATSAACANYIYAIDKSYEAGFVDFNKNISIPSRYDDRAVKFWSSIELKPFQSNIVQLAKTASNRRHIYYFWEPKGNVGKTILCEYLHIYFGAIITGGKAEDMKHAISRWEEITGADPLIIIIDIARSDSLNHESCKAIEAIKNGLFFDGKYESAMAHSFIKPHVFIFSNTAPDKSFFSNDRWKIAEILNDELSFDV